VTDVIVEYSAFATALITFYFGNDVYYGTAGCPAGTKERFRRSFHRTPEGKRHRKREVMLHFGRPGTNICFMPEGEGPAPAKAYLPGHPTEGTWRADDRLVIFMRDWEDSILGMLSLDNPVGGDRPDEETFTKLEDVDRFVNLVAKIAENRFWSLRVRESEVAYGSIFQATTDALLVLEPDGTVVEANPAASRLYELPYDELVGKSVKQVLPPAEQARCSVLLSRLEEGFAFRVEAQQLKADGSTFDAEVHGTALQYRGKLRLLTFSQDVTEKKRGFRKLLEEQKEESVVAIAGGVAHDFNNLLMGITGSVAMLRPLLRGGDAVRHADRIATSADRLAHLTRQLLAIARGVHSEPRPVTMTQVVQDNLGLLSGLVGFHYELDLRFPERPWTVVADRIQLGQVLLNLSQNACEAMAHGGRLRLEVKNVVRREGWATIRTGTHPPGNYVALIVEDEGSGMDADTLEHLFDPYFSTKPTGSGLGLAAVLGIVRRHRGSVRVQSEAGRGTRIEILLPRAMEEAVSAPLPAPEPQTGIARPRVLLVDDEDLVRNVTGEMLRELGCRVVSVASGASAIETYAADPAGFDIVLLDGTMPGMTGVEASRILIAADPDVRIILSSGRSEDLNRGEPLKSGRITGFLKKPFQLRELEAALAQALHPPRESH